VSGVTDRFALGQRPGNVRRLPPPWSVEDIDAAFVVKDGSGQKLAYVYYEEEPGRRIGSQAAHQRRGAAGLRSILLSCPSY